MALFDLLWVIWDPMHFVMEQRMLQGIKERAEGRPFVAPVVARIGPPLDRAVEGVVTLQGTNCLPT